MSEGLCKDKKESVSDREAVAWEAASIEANGWSRKDKTLFCWMQ